jgi:hypothetical protein
MENRQLRTLLNLGSVVLIAILVGAFIYVINAALKGSH